MADKILARLLFTTFCLIFFLSACSSYEQVSPEAQHETKVWILQKNPQIEHRYINELFSSLLYRLSSGYKTLGLEFPPHVKVYLVKNQTAGVFSLCDGTIFVSSGTFDHLSSAHELSALLAHDLAHVYFQHACVFRNAGDELVELELEADTLAIKTLQASYIDPQILKRVYYSIYRESEAKISEKSPEVEKTRLNNMKNYLSDLDQIPTKIPEERLFRKVKYVLSRIP